MAMTALESLWDEPRPGPSPARVWRDWVLVAAVLIWSVVEVALREDEAWRPLAFGVSIVVAVCVWWRRTHPLAAVAVSFGTLAAFDVARLLWVDVTALNSVAAVLLLPYALFRWGSGREATLGLGLILAWLGLTLVVTDVSEPLGVAEVVAGYGFFLFSAALGALVRYYAGARSRDIDQAKLRQRNDLARELHDTVGHHVSAIAITAQAGRIAAATDPGRALTALEIIEQSATRTLDEMRVMVGALRDGSEPDLAPQPGVADIARLAATAAGPLRVDVRLSGEFEGLNPSVGTALYRITQEALTNVGRHANRATRVTIDISDEGSQVRLTVHDDGEVGTAVGTGGGYGLLGMTERATVLGGSLRAGPATRGGWTVDAVLPKPVALPKLGSSA
ncbi:sensor histidine kinase [Propionibacteriaceae bacterium G1746]|uniref:sensor histidine kinase n=1 Tax=Aestuariimicrobium sp. G57 TaxID=3418485 RepID=UPI003C18ABC7